MPLNLRDRDESAESIMNRALPLSQPSHERYFEEGRKQPYPSKARRDMRENCIRRPDKLLLKKQSEDLLKAENLEDYRMENFSPQARHCG